VVDDGARPADALAAPQVGESLALLRALGDDVPERRLLALDDGVALEGECLTAEDRL